MGGNNLDNSPTVQITGTIMVIAIIVLFLVIVFVLFLHLYAKWFWWRVENAPGNTAAGAPPRRRHRRRFVFNPGQEPVRRGLDLSVLRSLPVVIFQANEFKDGLECAVCLSEVVQGEKARLLPKCNHGFHVDCIDMWFQSHSTCPLCRSFIAPQASNASASSPTNNHDDDNFEENISVGSPEEPLASHGYTSESPNFPTNVLFWGDETQVSTGCRSGSTGNSLEEGTSSTTQLSSSSLPSSSSAGTRQDGVLYIDVPAEISDNFAEEESKSPMPTRLRSLKRLLSRERRVAPSTSTSSGDV